MKPFARFTLSKLLQTTTGIGTRPEAKSLCFDYRGHKNCFYNFSTHQQRHRTVLPKNRSSSDNGRTRNKMSRNPLQPKQLFIGKPSSVKRLRTANESISRSKIHNNREKNRKILKFSSENLQVIPDRCLNLFQLKINRP